LRHGARRARLQHRGLESVALWHERDISHSSAERIVLPDASIALDYMLHRATSLIDNLVVYPERMLQNLGATNGLVFSGQLLLALTRAGASRERAYEWVQRNAMRVWNEGTDFQTLVREDTDISAHLSAEQIDAVFAPDTYLRNVDAIFTRVLRKRRATLNQNNFVAGK
jgi:adenylosuccinate lyase